MHCGNMVMNNLLFVDDIRMFTPSINGLRRLLNMCSDYAVEYEFCLIVTQQSMLFFS